MCEDIFMYEGELFCYGVGIDTPRENTISVTRALNPSGATKAFIAITASDFIKIKMT